METLDMFKKQREQTAAILRQLLVFLRTGEKFGVEIDPKFKTKLETGIKTTSDEKLKVALVGGFSEGKTSIAAAWAEKYDKSSMKISQQESSDEVVIYHMGDFDLIDTPGLFGYKETADKEKYKDITKKYVSEAHLVLYVMNPNNPIKESHKEELLWLFKDLNLLSRTVFVLSRFDEEVDIEDDNDYEKGLEIKRENITGRLRDFGIISGDDDPLSIAAVSANPFERGVDFWLAHLDEFKKLSHIETLQRATTEKIKAAGNTSALVEASKKSIISDILKRELPVAIERDEKIGRECERFAETCADSSRELESTKTKLIRSRTDLKEFILIFFTDLILQLEGTDMDTFSEFFQRNIGSEGIVLKTKLENEFERQLGGAHHAIKKMEISIDAGIQQYNNVIGGLAKDGLKKGSATLLNMTKISAEGIKSARNFIMPSLKFRPWGAVNLAKNLNKALPIVGQVIGIGLDLWDSISKAQKEAKFNTMKQEYKLNFEDQRKELLEFINDENQFIREFFPDYMLLSNKIEKLNMEMKEKEEQHIQFQSWREQGEAIEADFRIIV